MITNILPFILIVSLILSCYSLIQPADKSTLKLFVLVMCAVIFTGSLFVASRESASAFDSTIGTIICIITMTPIAAAWYFQKPVSEELGIDAQYIAPEPQERADHPRTKAAIQIPEELLGPTNPGGTQEFIKTHEVVETS